MVDLNFEAMHMFQFGVSRLSRERKPAYADEPRTIFELTKGCARKCQKASAPVF